MRRWDWGDPAQDLEQSTDLGRFFEADGEGNCQRRMDAASPTSHRSAIIWPRPFLLFISFLPFSFPSLSLSLSLSLSHHLSGRFLCTGFHFCCCCCCCYFYFNLKFKPVEYFPLLIKELDRSHSQFSLLLLLLLLPLDIRPINFPVESNELGNYSAQRWLCSAQNIPRMASPDFSTGGYSPPFSQNPTLYPGVEFFSWNLNCHNQP